MTRSPHGAGPEVLRGRSALIVGVLVAVAGLLFGGLTVAGAGTARSSGQAHPAVAPVPTPDPTPAPPRQGDSIPNVSRVENQIKAYYDDTVDANGDHVPSTTGRYAQQMTLIESEMKAYLAHHTTAAGSKPAVLFDVDDTTLNTYNYEIFAGFAYNPVTNADYVDNARFPAVFGMPALVNYAAAHGYTVFFLTGRPETQRPGTQRNLAEAGYTEAFGATRLFMRNRTSPPPYLTCEPTCTTAQYKSGTRAYISSLGYDIALNAGDQYSDLQGGYADQTVKVPNPMYFLP